MTDREIRSALSERDTLTLTLLGEARGEELEGRLAVACVIRNRVRDPERWGDTFKDVCLEPMQFSCWQPAGGAANYRSVMEIATLLVQDHAIKSTFVPDALFRETRWLADGILAGVVRDRVSGANHYLTRALWETAPPKWARGVSPIALIQRHAFFRL